MAKIPYIDYRALEEFYTIPDACKLLNMSKKELKVVCYNYGIDVRRNEIGEPGFVKYDIRKLHNALYHEANRGNDDPWA